jgi:hypothetical protein
VQICFDINWYDTWQRLKRKGVKIVFFPSAYPAAQQLSALALVNRFYIVSSAAPTGLAHSLLPVLFRIDGEHDAFQSGCGQPERTVARYSFVCCSGESLFFRAAGRPKGSPEEVESQAYIGEEKAACRNIE